MAKKRAKPDVPEEKKSVFVAAGKKRKLYVARLLDQYASVWPTALDKLGVPLAEHTAWLTHIFLDDEIELMLLSLPEYCKKFKALDRTIAEETEIDQFTAMSDKLLHFKVKTLKT